MESATLLPIPTDPNIPEITSLASSSESQEHTTNDGDAKDENVEGNASSDNPDSARTETSSSPVAIEPASKNDSVNTDSATQKTSNAAPEITLASDEASLSEKNPKPIDDTTDEALLSKKDPPAIDDTNNQKAQKPNSESSQNDKNSDIGNLCSLIHEELKYMKSDPYTLRKYGDTVKDELDTANKDLEKLTKLLNDKDADQDAHQKKLQESLRKELRELKRRVTKLKAKFPSKVKIHKLEKASKGKDGEDSRGSQIDNLVAQGKTQLFSLHDSKQFKDSEVFRNFESLYKSLDSHLKKLCLLTFSVFPENAMIRKRIMIYWWMADGFIKDIDEKDESVPVKGSQNESVPGNGTQNESVSVKGTQNESVNVNGSQNESVTGNGTQNESVSGNDTQNHYSAAKKKGAIFLKEFTEKGFLIPIIMKPGSAPHSYQVHPMARIVLVSLAKKEHLFDFKDGSPTESYEHCLRACLVGEGLANSSHLEKLHMIFNIDESIVEFKQEWFPKMENLNILHLGRWQSEEKHHIEIEDPDLLDHLQHLKFLKFLSLQGVSRVTVLPESIGKLGSLKFLDLRACHNLEVIPAGLGNLKTLTHLDMSDCYLIDHSPKEISELKNLLVLKGFIIVGDTKDKKLKKGSCTLKDLGKSLSKLKKLGIYTSVYPIPNDEVEALQKFKELWTLSISWGSTPKPETQKGQNKVVQMQKTIKRAITFKAEATPVSSIPKKVQQNQSHLNLPPSLVKLELNCYPHHRAPQWLKREKLPELKKLYIRGGKLSELGAVYDWKDGEGPSLTENTWSVEILRLKYLAGMDMGWREFCHLFPKLILLENVNCPKLTLFPCDDLGVWSSGATKQS